VPTRRYPGDAALAHLRPELRCGFERNRIDAQLSGGFGEGRNVIGIETLLRAATRQAHGLLEDLGTRLHGFDLVG
jgi:hypothetical protein